MRIQPGILVFCALTIMAPDPVQAQEDEQAQRGISITTADSGLPAIEDMPRQVMDRTPVLPGLGAVQGDNLSVIPSFRLKRVQLDGAGILPAEEVNRIAAGYIDRDLSFEELARLKNELSMAYFDLGFVNSGVLLPDQKVDDGTVRFTEVEGRLTQVNLDGNQALDDRFWLARLESAAGAPLKINALQEALQIIEQQPLVHRIEARLVPGANPGESRLDLDVEENRPWRLSLGFNNHRSPSLGGEQFVLSASHLSLSGNGDTAEILWRESDGLGDYALAYSFPLNRHDSRLRFYWSEGDAEIVEAPFNVIDIKSRTRTAGFELRHPISISPSHEFSGFAGVESLHSDTTLLGIPFSFSLGEVNGEADATAMVVGLAWTRRSAKQFMAMQLSARKGVDWFDARVSPFIPEGLVGPELRYLSFRGLFQYVRRLDWQDSELHARAAFQLAEDALLPVEKMPIGGVQSVRGFRENLLVRDNAWSASIEWRRPLFNDLPETGGFNPRALTLAVFADAGHSWDEHTGLPSDRREKISSVGLGLLWNPSESLEAQLFFGQDLDKAPGQGDNLQDDGWHFGMTWHF